MQFIFGGYNFKSVTGEFPGLSQMYCASQHGGPTSLHLGTSMFYGMGSYLLDDKPLQSSCLSPSLSYSRKALINSRSASYQSSTRALGQHRMIWIKFLCLPSMSWTTLWPQHSSDWRSSPAKHSRLCLCLKKNNRCQRRANMA